MPDDPPAIDEAADNVTEAHREIATPSGLGQPDVESTSSPTVQTADIPASEYIDVSGSTGRNIKIVEARRETRYYQGPLPDPETLKELCKVYPDAAKAIFSEFKAQGAHRRELESSTIAAKNKRADRGQWMGFAIGETGLVGSLLIAAFVSGWAGFGIALTSVGALASIFVYGRQSEKREREKKEDIRQKIARGDPVEEIEKSDGPPQLPSPGHPAP